MSRLSLVPVWLAVFAYVHAMRLATARPVAALGRCLMALLVAVAGYLLVMLPAIHAFPSDRAHAATTYALAMALATMAGASIAGLVLPRRLRDAGMALCTGLAMAYPVLVALTSMPEAPIRFTQCMYVLATAFGGYCALNWGPALAQRLFAVGAPARALTS